MYNACLLAVWGARITLLSIGGVPAIERTRAPGIFKLPVTDVKPNNSAKHLNHTDHARDRGTQPVITLAPIDDGAKPPEDVKYERDRRGINRLLALERNWGP